MKDKVYTRTELSLLYSKAKRHMEVAVDKEVARVTTWMARMAERAMPSYTLSLDTFTKAQQRMLLKRLDSLGYSIESDGANVIVSWSDDKDADDVVWQEKRSQPLPPLPQRHSVHEKHHYPIPTAPYNDPSTAQR